MTKGLVPEKFAVAVEFLYDYHNGGPARSNSYNFITDKKDYSPGDLLIVDTINGPQVGRLKAYSTKPPSLIGAFRNKTPRWVIAKVDTSEHEARIEKEKRTKEIKQQLEVARQKAEEMQIYEMLAEKDENIAELLNELKSMGGQ